MSSGDVLTSIGLEGGPPTAVARMAARVLSALDHDLDELLEDATLTVCTVLGVDCCAVVQLDAEGDGLRVRAGHAPAWRVGIERVEVPLPALPRGLLIVSYDAARAWGAAELAFLSAVAELLDRAIERQLVEAELRGRALHDALTGLPNRRLLMERLAETLAARDRETGALLFIDLDQFKQVNDTLGHRAGDQLLHLFARRLLAVLRPGDILARLGGDEFVVLSPDLTLGGATVVADRVLAVAAEPFTLDAGVAHVTASIGIAAIGPDDTPERLLAAADDALYVAKRSGRATHRPARLLIDPPAR